VSKDSVRARAVIFVRALNAQTLIERLGGEAAVKRAMRAEAFIAKMGGRERVVSATKLYGQAEKVVHNGRLRQRRNKAENKKKI
jgi:hypothetical protein